MGDKNKKKLTKKEQKAINHANLMSHKKNSGVPGATSSNNSGQQPNNVIQLNQFQNKKAA